MMLSHHANIPEQYSGFRYPILADEESWSLGEDIFSENCAICHGDGGIGDGSGGANLNPAPAPIAHTSLMLSDAYLFWRVSEGVWILKQVCQPIKTSWTKKVAGI